jgi:hypothetical protein
MNNNSDNSDNDIDDIEKLNIIACKNKKFDFIHPTNSRLVMSSYSHYIRGKCCGNKCMFCVYGHENVKNHICTYKSCPYVTTEYIDYKE